MSWDQNGLLSLKLASFAKALSSEIVGRNELSPCKFEKLSLSLKNNSVDVMIVWSSDGRWAVTVDLEIEAGDGMG
jgi:hypothetical protein